jgi:hypothetical protein
MKSRRGYPVNRSKELLQLREQHIALFRRGRVGIADNMTIDIPQPPSPLPWWWNLPQFKQFQKKVLDLILVIPAPAGGSSSCSPSSGAVFCFLFVSNIV